MTAFDAAVALDEIALLLQLNGESEFKARAYSQGAESLRALDLELAPVVAAGQLSRIPYLNGVVGEKVGVLVRTGRLPFLDDLREKTPAGLRQLVRVPGLGPKKARALFDALQLNSLQELEAACASGRVAKVKGFGDKSAERILGAVRYLLEAGDRLRLDHARRVGEQLADALAVISGASVEPVGEIRRGVETVGEIVLLASADDPAGVLAALGGIEAVTEVVESGAAGARVRVQVAYRTRRLIAVVRVHACHPDEFAWEVLRLTGPASHLVALEALAAPKLLAGVARGCETEDEVYATLGLEFVPPELRDDPSMLELARRRDLPRLLRPSDLCGVFHNHTTASDGSATLAEMADAAAALGYEYLGIGDHSQSLTVANGLTPDRVRHQWREIDALNAARPGFTVFKGTECDILQDGSLDFGDDLLGGFDYVVGSVHSHFGLPEAEQTARVCKALSHPKLTMLGHATGRLLLRRAGYAVDLGKVVRCAAEHGKVIEINAQPDRLDIDAPHAKLAASLGVPIAINPDAHSTGDLDKAKHGVTVARRAGLTAAQVLNTRGRDEVAAEFARRRAGG